MLLNRRHLRIKVLQELYAYYQSEETDYKVREKELDNSVGKVYDQYVFWLSLINELKSYSDRRIEENKSKQLPVEDDLNPNLKFVNNRILDLLSRNKQLRKETEQRKISWSSHLDIIKRTIEEIKANDAYSEYMSSETNSFEEDRDFVAAIFKKVIARL